MERVLHPGITGTSSFLVEERQLADKVGSGLVSVFSTAMMIAGMEATAVAAVQPFLAPGETTVGVHVDVAHKAATPCGMRVRFDCELLEVSPGGRSLLFKVQAFDEAGLIGEGQHRRVVVNRERFEAATRDKARHPETGRGGPEPEKDSKVR